MQSALFLYKHASIFITFITSLLHFRVKYNSKKNNNLSPWVCAYKTCHRKRTIEIVMGALTKKVDLNIYDHSHDKALPLFLE